MVDAGWLAAAVGGTSLVPVGSSLVLVGTRLVPVGSSLVPVGTRLVPVGTSLVPVGTAAAANPNSGTNSDAYDTPWRHCTVGGWSRPSHAGNR